MKMGYTKKVGSKRCMRKSIEDWYGLNKSTPDQWFDRWQYFLVNLMKEIGYYFVVSGRPVDKPRGKLWTQRLDFRHKKLARVVIIMTRMRKQEGGDIQIDYGSLDGGHLIDTLSKHKSGTYSVMSRKKVGDVILNRIRDGWKKYPNEPTGL